MWRHNRRLLRNSSRRRHTRSWDDRYSGSTSHPRTPASRPTFRTCAPTGWCTRIVRPPSYGAQLRSVETAAIEKMPGVKKVVRDGNFLAVIADREYRAIKAMNALALAAQWDERATM